MAKSFVEGARSKSCRLIGCVEVLVGHSTAVIRQPVGTGMATVLWLLLTERLFDEDIVSRTCESD